MSSEARAASVTIIPTLSRRVADAVHLGHATQGEPPADRYYAVERLPPLRAVHD